MMNSLIDRFGRTHNNLRISVTDRCNIRCFYCMPADNVQFLARSKLLSFEEIERAADDGIDGSSRTYEDQLKFAEKEAARTPGWRAIGTPSKRFVILTNAEKQAFIKEVIKRLEISRDVFEEDFPPPADFKAVSVVRICKDRQEFQRFSGAGGGVAADAGATASGSSGLASAPAVAREALGSAAAFAAVLSSSSKCSSSACTAWGLR